MKRRHDSWFCKRCGKNIWIELCRCEDPIVTYVDDDNSPDDAEDNVVAACTAAGMKKRDS